MQKNIFKLLSMADISSEEYASIQKLISQKNFHTLRAYSFIATFFFTITLSVALVSGMDDMMSSLFAYILGLVSSLCIFFISLWAGEKHYKVIDALQIVFEIILLVFGMILAFREAPDESTIALMTMFMIIPHLFTNKPFFVQVPVLITVIIFIILSFEIKSTDILPLEILDCVVYSSVGLVTGFYATRSKLKGLVFEKRVSELNDTEQLATYLKSIGNIYISLHYINLNNLTFVELKSTQFINNSVKNLHENFDKQIQLAMKATTSPEYVKETLAFADISTLRERIRGKFTITHEFMSIHFGWCRARFIAVGEVTPNSAPNYIIYAVESINEQKNRENTLITKAETDAMTGLLNRQTGIDKITTCIHKKDVGMLCLFDVDKFKNVNDTYGHQAGDEVIIAVADTMRKAFRENDILLRLGGDEFIVYVSNITTEELGTHIISRFFELLNKAQLEKIPDYKISMSLGAAFYKGEPDLDFETLYHRADTRTYESKKIEGKSFTFWR